MVKDNFIRNIIILIVIMIVILLFIYSVSAGLPIYPKDVTMPNQYILYNFTLVSGDSCDSEALLSNASIIHLDVTGVGFYDLNISSLTSMPKRICVYRDSGVLIANLSYADMIFNSLRVNDLIVNNANISNLTVDNIRSRNWSNVTILESQISNLQAYLLASDQRYNDTAFIQTNYVPYTGATGDVNLNNRKLTAVGELVMQGVITSQDIVPVTDSLYSLGNSTNWFEEIFVKKGLCREYKYYKSNS